MKSYNDTANLELEGTLIATQPTFYVSITMSPDCVGRAELPDYLAALSRPVAMMVLDYALFGYIKFYEFGFADARVFKFFKTDRFSHEYSDVCMASATLIAWMSESLCTQHNAVLWIAWLIHYTCVWFDSIRFLLGVRCVSHCIACVHEFSRRAPASASFATLSLCDCYGCKGQKD
eukprot:2197168-Amphidinium_carterae.1